jgi:Protein of unknown function (DUF2752)
MTASVHYDVDCTKLRVPALAAVCGALVLAHVPSDVGIPCPLRSLTGVPCPFCGVTTSLRAMGGGHFLGALRAAPLGLVVLGVSVLAMMGRLPRRLRLPVPLLVSIIGAEWVFELARFHVI